MEAARRHDGNQGGRDDAEAHALWVIGAIPGFFSNSEHADTAGGRKGVIDSI
jgi:hypothetical protein